MFIALTVLIVVLFLAMRLLGGDPVRVALGPTAPAEIVAARRQALHLNDPLPLQLGRYLVGLIHLDLGESIVSGELVAAALAPRLYNTASLALIILYLHDPRRSITVATGQTGDIH